MNRLSLEKRAQIVAALVEGNSIHATSRMFGVSKDTVMKLQLDAGNASAEYQDKTLRNLKCKRIQCDEIWEFVYAKEKNVPTDKKGEFGYGDVWTWTAVDADTKLVPSFMVGKRDVAAAYYFIRDLAERMANRIQLTTDGLKVYINAVEESFGCEIDYAMLAKIYGSSQEEVRYSPALCLGAEIRTVQGNPDPDHISTSYVERQNLTMRMSMRRFTRLTNGFSKKVENHAASVALHFMHYNFCRVHKTLRVTPAMEAGLTDHVWTIEEMLTKINS